jgi:endoglucanase
MENGLANATEEFSLDDDTAMAWIMYNSSDWSVMYGVGDVYDPTGATAGVVATDVEVTGEGTYTVSLDFSGLDGGYANSTVFCAVAIANGETLFPGYIMDIKEVDINGEPYTLDGRAYTTSDDGKCTRVNLYNGWVTAVPDDARLVGGTTVGANPCVLDPEKLGNITTISVTFDYKPGN